MLADPCCMNIYTCIYVCVCVYSIFQELHDSSLCWAFLIPLRSFCPLWLPIAICGYLQKPFLWNHCELWECSFLFWVAWTKGFVFATILILFVVWLSVCRLMLQTIYVRLPPFVETWLQGNIYPWSCCSIRFICLLICSLPWWYPSCILCYRPIAWNRDANPSPPVFFTSFWSS